MKHTTLSVTDAAKKRRVSRQRILTLIGQGRIHATKDRWGRYEITTAALAALVMYPVGRRYAKK